MTQIDEFDTRKRVAIENMVNDRNLSSLTNRWFIESYKYKSLLHKYDHLH